MRRYILLAALMFMCGCSRSYGSMEGDLLCINGSMYICQNITIPDQGLIEKEIGRVRNRISGKDRLEGYTIEEGDSFNLKKGAAIYKLKGYDIESMVAVKSEEGSWLVYVNEDRKDNVIETMKEDMVNAEAVYVKHICGGKGKTVKYITNSDLINYIRSSIQKAPVYDEEIDSYDELYTIEFITQNDEYIYNPCIVYLLRVSEDSGECILLDNEVKNIGNILKEIMQDKY